MAKVLQINPLDSLEKLLDKSFIDKSNTLLEKGKTFNGQSFSMRRELISKPDISFLLTRFDPNQVTLFPYFLQTSGLRKICDYLLFVVENNQFYIILIELKYGTESATKQLESTEIFAKFLIDSGKKIKLDFPENYNIIKVRVSEERARNRNRGTKIKGLQSDINGIINYDHSNAFRIKEVITAVFN
jgi:hypothetical protein